MRIVELLFLIAFFFSLKEPTNEVRQEEETENQPSDLSVCLFDQVGSAFSRVQIV